MLFKLCCSLATLTALSAETSRYLETLYETWGQSIVMSEEIHREKTEHQDLVIFQNPIFGRVLALDGVIQTTEADEAIYHEMMVHVPLFAHENPTSVLVIGGGDGGILREVLKHASVQRALLVELDAGVMNLSKKYLPKLSNGAFDDPRVEVVIQDASEYVKTCKETFDVILCDSTDPFGPGKVLFTPEFYALCKKLLRKNGIFVNQNGVPFLQKEELTLTLKNRSPYFKHVTFYTAAIPSYVGGLMAFGWASDKKYRISEQVLEERLAKIKGPLYYYTPGIHKASFVLPGYMNLPEK
ncbi:MAG: polyamine aminopropyltransferase [Verrucomicrobiota bacterium]|nr:polyamine aminopropyltransferase [Verrucomicrobiota bacterium]